MEIRMTQDTPEVLLTHDDSNLLKGIAACFVILSHAVYAAQAKGLLQAGIFTLLTQLGGIGVLIFFFLSGYGIYKGYGERKLGPGFLGKRIRNIVVPVVIIKVFLYFIMDVSGRKFNLQEILVSFQSEWFVAIILIEYVLFCVSWIAVRTECTWKKIICDTLLNICLIAVFVCSHADPKWYNGVLLFPAGMLAAKYERQLIGGFGHWWGTSLAICTALLALCSLCFMVYKGVWWSNIFKTGAGIALGLLFCIIFLKIRFYFAILNFIGKRSLYYYVIHVNLVAVLKMDFVTQLMWILLYTVILSELFYRMTAKLYWPKSKDKVSERKI